MTELNHPVLQSLKDALFEEHQLEISVLRLDTIHPVVSGNKLYKLKYNLEAFQKSGKEYLVTFGGAYSNHIVATAAAGKESGIRTIGIIRGEELNPDSNGKLRFAAACGMKLVFVKREDYRLVRTCLKPVAGGVEAASNKWEIIIKFLSGIGLPGPGLQDPESRFCFLQEGGSNELAVKGCREISKAITTNFDVIACAVGTGATLAGISASLNPTQKALGIAVLRGETFLEKDILNMNGGIRNFELQHNYHLNGYARSHTELDDFCKWFTETHRIPVEPVYTGKLFYALYQLAKKNFFEPHSKVIAVHTGGVFDTETSQDHRMPGSSEFNRLF